VGCQSRWSIVRASWRLTHIIEIAPTSEGESQIDRRTVISSAIDVKNYLLNIMTSATDTDIREIKDLIAAGNTATQKQIADLDKRIEVGFAKLEGKIDTVEAKLEGKIDKLDERTKLGFWGFIFRGTALAAIAAMTAIFIKYLFPILPTIPNM
jgi:hypothetical protein